jgi:two-component system, sensor histidine kinase and response regulator
MDHSLSKLVQFAQKLKLLYIEDDESSRIVTLDVLKLFFKNIVVAVNGEDGILKYDTNSIDFIMTDINMPKKNGIEFIQYVRQENREIPIFIISAHSETSFFLDSISLGVDGYLIKPLNSEQFIEQVRKKVHKLYLQQQLIEYHKNLEQKVIEQVEELREKDKILIQQSKLATMGEMMDIIAHQWKQPINMIAMNTSLVKEMYDEEKGISFEEIDGCYIKVKSQIEHLVSTLDDFRAFFRPNENIQFVSIKQIVDSVLLLIHDELIKNGLILSLNIQEDKSISVNPSEIKHIFINLINNARDAYEETQIPKKVIDITTKCEDKNIIIYIQDYAGGVPDGIKDDIFRANFTSKAHKGGTGIGLYMSNFIAKKNHGSMGVINKNGGACFYLSFPYK